MMMMMKMGVFCRLKKKCMLLGSMYYHRAPQLINGVSITLEFRTTFTRASESLPVNVGNDETSLALNHIGEIHNQGCLTDSLLPMCSAPNSPSPSRPASPKMASRTLSQDNNDPPDNGSYLTRDGKHEIFGKRGEDHPTLELG